MRSVYAFVVIAFVACGSEVDKRDDTAGSGGADAQGGQDQATSSSTGDTTLSVGGATPNCASCTEDEFCDYYADTCGPIESGTCGSKDACRGEGPVCTCAGTVEVDDCAAYASGQDLSKDANCTPPPNTFRCGGFFCDDGTEICVHTSGLVSESGCPPAPSACVPDANGALSCDCVVDMGCMCEEVEGQLVLRCSSD